MAFSNESLTQAAFKKLFGLAHTETKGYPLGNEKNPTQLTIMASDVYLEEIPSTAQSISGRIAPCTNSANGQVDSYLSVVFDSSVASNDAAQEGIPYIVKVPSGHG